MSRRNRRRDIVSALTALAMLVSGGERATGQERTTSVPETSAPRAAGWIFTPTLVYSGGWDDNVLLQDRGDQSTGDFLTVINPRSTLDYMGRHTQFTANYDGAFLLYRSLNTLNSYDQRGSLSLEHRLTRRVTLFAMDTGAITPTTSAVEFVGVPFLRTGSRINETRGGAQIALTKRTSISAAYSVQWVDFDANAAFGNQFLFGGFSQGITATARHVLNKRLSLVADYNVLHGVINGQVGGFDVQNGEAGIEYRLSDVTQISAAGGVSKLGVSSFGPARTGPAWRAGLTRQVRKAGLDLSYSRSFVPSYGFGGTMQNEEAIVRVRTPITRRVMAQSSVSWRRNEPLTPGELKLVSWWVDGAIGYGLTPWLRIEGFYNGVRQTIDRPGGILDRNHIGFQLVLTQPVRIQ